MYDYVCKTTPMYEIKTRFHMIPISWVAAMPVLSQFRLPGHSEITVIKTDQEEAQAYWEIIGFGKNIFSSKDDDKIRAHFANERKRTQVNSWHKLLWPSLELPSAMKARHAQGQDSEQEVWWRKSMFTTSVAFSWIVWGIATPRRMHEEKERSRRFLGQLINHILETQGRICLNVSQIGDPAAKCSTEVTAQNGTIDSRLLWTRAIYNRVYQIWNINKLNRNHWLDSDISRPTLLDLIAFAFDSSCQPDGGLLQPLALSLVQQLAQYVDTNLARLSIEPVKEEEHRSKNRKLDHSLFLQKVTRAALFLLNENDAGSRRGRYIFFLVL